jgi:hypothetical protein
MFITIALITFTDIQTLLSMTAIGKLDFVERQQYADVILAHFIAHEDFKHYVANCINPEKESGVRAVFTSRINSCMQTAATITKILQLQHLAPEIFLTLLVLYTSHREIPHRESQFASPPHKDNTVYSRFAEMVLTIIGQLRQVHAIQKHTVMAAIYSVTQEESVVKSLFME